jgi:hypothetical protein
MLNVLWFFFILKNYSFIEIFVSLQELRELILTTRRIKKKFFHSQLLKIIKKNSKLRHPNFTFLFIETHGVDYRPGRFWTMNGEIRRWFAEIAEQNTKFYAMCPSLIVCVNCKGMRRWKKRNRKERNDYKLCMRIDKRLVWIFYDENEMTTFFNLIQ